MKAVNLYFYFAIVPLICSMALAENLYTVKPVRFKHVGTVYENGWHWCKSKGARLEWYWEPIQNITNEFYVLYTLLQSDEDGRAGLSSEKIEAVLIVEYLAKECRSARPSPPFGGGGVIPINPFSRCVLKWRSAKVATSYLKMVNTFKPVDITQDEMKYLARGYVKFHIPPSLIKAVRAFEFKISIRWPPRSDNYYFAGSSRFPPVIVFKK